MLKTTVALLLLFATAAPAMAQSQPQSCPAVLQHTFKRLQDDAPQDLCQYAGKVVLVVNTASYCGFTKQYKGLRHRECDMTVPVGGVRGTYNARRNTSGTKVAVRHLSTHQDV